MSNQRLDILERTMLLMAVAQIAALLLHDLGRDPAGHPLQVSVVNALMLQLPLHLSALGGQGMVWALAATRWPRARLIIDPLGAIIATIVIVLTHVDLGMQRFRGERLSLNHLTLYGSTDVANSDWIRPMLDMPGFLATALMLLVGTLLLLWHPWRPGGAVPRHLRSFRTPLLYAVVALAGQVPGQIAFDHQRVLALSPQETLLREALNPPEPLSPEEQQAALADLRRAIDPLGRGGWRTAAYPLWRSSDFRSVPGAGMAQQDPPDIILFTIESLRGRDVGWGFEPRTTGASVTPHLDSLARASVTFPQWIAGGEPSPRGFVTLHNGAWEHGRGFIIANFPEVRVDVLPQRLRTAGYRTMAIWGGNPSFDNQLTWARRWYDVLDFELPGNALFYRRTRSDRLVMDRLLAHVAAHDAAHDGTPFFAYVASNGTHTPYALDDGEAAAARDASSNASSNTSPTMSRQARYDRVLRNVDAQIGRVIAALRQRPRWRNTVVIVTGDHADRTDETADPEWTGMPTDAQVATAALMFGPNVLIGSPRAITMPVSHTDLLPTVLGWIGDTSGVTTLGRSVFDTAAQTAREVVSINSRGVRLDRGGYSLMVATEDPRRFRAWRAFTGERPIALPLAATPFAADDPARLLQRVRYWSFLVEHNQVRPAW